MAIYEATVYIKEFFDLVNSNFWYEGYCDLLSTCRHGEEPTFPTFRGGSKLEVVEDIAHALRRNEMEEVYNVRVVDEK